MIEFSRNVGKLTKLAELLLLGSALPPPLQSLSDDPNSEPLDPYLEEVSTLWVLHWHLATTKKPASSFHLFFCEWPGGFFTRDELCDWIFEKAHLAGNRVNSNTIRRDVEVLLKSYCPISETNQSVDAFSPALSELSLIRSIRHKFYVVERQQRPSINSYILAYALAEFFDRAGKVSAISLERLLYDPGAPGTVFRLSREFMIDQLKSLPTYMGFVLDDTASNCVVIRRKVVHPLQILVSNYLNRR